MVSTIPPLLLSGTVVVPTPETSTPAFYNSGPKIWEKALNYTILQVNLDNVVQTNNDSVTTTLLGVLNDTVAGTMAGANSTGSATNDALHTNLEFILIAFMGAFFSIITIVGNLMVMISIKMDKQLQTISNYFLLSLAIADFSIGIISMPLSTYYMLYNYWYLGPFMCDTWLAWDYLTSNASVLNLLIISFDRYFSVTRPLTYRAFRTTRRSARWIAIAWVISLLLWPPWIYAWPYIEGKRSVPEGQCYIQFFETNIYVTFGTALAAFYIPVCVMCILYWRIWQETEKRQRDLTHLQAGKGIPSSSGCRRNKSGELGGGGGGGGGAGGNFNQLAGDGGGNQLDHNNRTASTLCLESGRYLPSSSTAAAIDPSAGTNLRGSNSRTAPNKQRRSLRDVLFAWCRSDKLHDDDSCSSHGSPNAQTPTSAETPIRADSMQYKPLQNIPLTDRQHQTSTRSFSSDSVYTILIRLPTQTSVDLDGEMSQASIRMILEDDGPPPCQSTRPIPRSKSASSNAPSREPLLLNTKLVAQQATKRLPKKKRKHQERKQERKAAKTLSAILLAFIVTWTPYNVLVLIKTLSPCDDDNDCIPQGLWNFAYCLCYINSTVNPLCYALCNANFRRTYVRILTCKWHTKKQRHRGYFS